MAPHGIVLLRSAAAKMRAIHFLLTVGMAFGPACAPMPTKPIATVLVTGKVTDRLGSPIVKADVAFYPGMSSLAAFYDPQRAATDSSGSYSLELVAGIWEFRVDPPENVGYNPYSRPTRVTVSPNQSKFDHVFSGFHVKGRVIAPTGAVLNDAVLYAIGGNPYTITRSHTESGAFSFLLPAGSYDISASPLSPSGFPPQNLDDIIVQADTTFDFLLGGDLVTGTVYGPGGAPLDSVLVTASGIGEGVRARTALDGSYALYAHAGNYRFICEPGGSDSYILTRISTLWSISGPATIDFDLSGVEWTGTVRSSATLSPIAGVGVNAVLFGDVYYRSARTTTDASGHFRLVLEPNREYSLTFHSAVTEYLVFPGFFAAADTTFDILIDPVPAP